MKKCAVCGEAKPLDEYHKMSKSKDGRQSRCKECHKKGQKKWAGNNREKLREKSKERYENIKNTDRYREHSKKYYQYNKETILERNRKNYIKNKRRYSDRRNAWAREKRKTDVNYRLKCILRTRLLRAVTQNHKQSSMIDLLGCTIDELKTHLENQFTEGMTWDNQGEWHIDHIKPCASFNLALLSEQQKCFHYSNLQPLWAKDNLEKADSIHH